MAKTIHRNLAVRDLPEDDNALLSISSDRVELVLDSPAIPESGTASVRARPTVKHHAVSISITLCGAHIKDIHTYHSHSLDGEVT